MKVVKRYKLLVLSTYWDVMYSTVIVISNTLLHIGKSLRDLKNFDHKEEKTFCNCEVMDVNET